MKRRFMKRRNSWLWCLVIIMLLALIQPMYAYAQDDEPPVVTRLEPAADHSVIRNNSLHVVAEAVDDLTNPSFLVEIGLGGAGHYFDPKIAYDGDQGAGRFIGPPPKGYHGVVHISMISPEGEDYDLSLETMGEGYRNPRATTEQLDGTEYSAAGVLKGETAVWRVKGHTDDDYSPDKKVIVYVSIRYDNH